MNFAQEIETVISKLQNLNVQATYGNMQTLMDCLQRLSNVAVGLNEEKAGENDGAAS